jgi:hypothetical protein
VRRLRWHSFDDDGMQVNSSVRALCRAHGVFHQLRPSSAAHVVAPLCLRAQMSTTGASGAAASSPAFLNFARASSLDEFVHGCERPCALETYDKPGAIPRSAVDEWAAYLKKQQIKRVLCLLNPGELGFFAEPGYEKGVQAAGLHVTMVDVFAPGACDRALAALSTSVAAKERIAVHCSGGEGRTGVVLGAWLAKTAGLSPVEAEERVISEAKRAGANRRPKAAKIAAFIKNGTLA